MCGATALGVPPRPRSSLLALVGGAGAALWQAREARAAAARAEAVNAFLVTLLAAASPEVDGRDVRMADLLDRAVATLDSAFTGTPETEAQLRLTLGITYRTLGLFDEAERAQLRRALALRTALYGDGHPEVADVQLSLGRFYYEHGQYAASDSILTIALATETRHSGPNSLRAANVLNALGNAQYEVGNFEEAARLAPRAPLRRSHDRARRPRPEHRAYQPRQRPRRPRALRRGRGAVRAGHRGAAPVPPGQTCRSPTRSPTSAPFATTRDEAEEAAALHQEATDLFRPLLGPDHFKLGLALNNLGSTWGDLGRLAESEAALRSPPRIFGGVGPDHPDQGYPLRNLALTLLHLGRTDEAETVTRRALALFDAAFEPGAALPARTRLILAAVLLETDRPAEAEALIENVQPIPDEALPDDHRDRAYLQSLLGDALRCQGRNDEAAPLLEAGHALFLRTLGPDDLRTREAALRLASPQGCTRTGPPLDTPAR